MKTGTARQGMRVRIVGNHNSHGFRIGQVITLDSKSQLLVNNYGYAFLALSESDNKRFFVREVDMAPVGATLV